MIFSLLRTVTNPMHCLLCQMFVQKFVLGLRKIAMFFLTYFYFIYIYIYQIIIIIFFIKKFRKIQSKHSLAVACHYHASISTRKK